MQSFLRRGVLLSCFLLVSASWAEVRGSVPPEGKVAPSPVAPGATTELAALPPELAASHVLIQYAGSERARPEVTRTKAEAFERARQVLAQARSGANFTELARKYSDDPTAASNGGFLGVFSSERMVPQFSRACAGLADGEIGEVTETPFGYHVIRREKIERASARQILVMYRGSQRASSEVTRTKEEALFRAREALARVKAGADFGQVAAEYSDGPTDAHGGDLGSFPRGAMVPEFDRAVFSLEVGGISDVVETPFGYHVILRYE